MAIAEHGSLGAAAEALQLTQPTVSARLNVMERQLGLRLVERSPRGSRLTAQGMAVTDWSRSVLTESDRFEAALEALRRQRSGQLRIAASMTIAEYLVPQWLSELRSHMPEISVSLQVHNSEDVARQVLAQEADVGFIESVSVPSGLVSRDVGADRLVAIVGPSHRWAKRRSPVSLDQLLQARLALRESGSGTREAFDRAIAALGVSASPDVELGSTSAIKAAVLSSDVVGVVSELALRDELRHGALFAVDVAELQLNRRLRATWPEGKRLIDSAAALVRLAALR